MRGGGGDESPHAFCGWNDEWCGANPDLLALGHAVADLSTGAFGKIATLLPLLGKRTKTIQSMAQSPALLEDSQSE